MTRKERKGKKQESKPAFTQPMTPEESVLPTEVDNEIQEAPKIQMSKSGYDDIVARLKSYSSYVNGISGTDTVIPSNDYIVNEPLRGYSPYSSNNVDYKTTSLNDIFDEVEIPADNLRTTREKLLDEQSVLLSQRTDVAKQHVRYINARDFDSARIASEKYSELSEKIKHYSREINKHPVPHRTEGSARKNPVVTAKSSKIGLGDYGYYTEKKSFTDDDMDITQNYKYRCLLGNNGITQYFIKYADSVKLTDSELLDRALSGEDKLVRLVANLPSKKVETKKKDKYPKGLGGFVPRRPVSYVGEPIQVEDFITKTNDLFGGESVPADVFYGLYTRRTGITSLLRDIEAKRVIANNVLKNNTMDIIGITTGVVNTKGIEVISLNTARAGNYTTKTNFAIRYLDPNTFKNPGQNNQISNFFRFKVISAEASNNLLSQPKKKLRTSWIGKILPGEFLLSIAYEFVNAGAETPSVVFVFLDSESGSNIKFLAKDIQIIPLIKEKILTENQKKDKTIGVGKVCIISDDRRLSILKKGDLVTVKGIKKNNSNMKNSIVIVQTDKSKTQQQVLLKQLKAYVTDNK